MQIPAMFALVTAGGGGTSIAWMVGAIGVAGDVSARGSELHAVSTKAIAIRGKLAA